MATDSETLAFLAQLESGPPQHHNDQLVPHGERKCPICGTRMVVEIQHGISLDVCQAHGVWLDRGELSDLASRIRSGERLSRMEAIRDARREGKLSAMVFGAWSLWMDR